MEVIMNIKNISFIILIIILQSCRSSNEAINSPATPSDYVIYNIVSIKDMNMADFEQYIKGSEYPIQIKLRVNDTLFTGSVTLKKLGERKISNDCTINKCFIINTKGELGDVDCIIFIIEEKTNSYIKGKLSYYGEILDSVSWSFEAVNTN
jgi:hypothetical protein